jgi:hypothetical protein
MRAFGTTTTVPSFRRPTAVRQSSRVISTSLSSSTIVSPTRSTRSMCSATPEMRLPSVGCMASPTAAVRIAEVVRTAVMSKPKEASTAAEAAKVSTP